MTSVAEPRGSALDALEENTKRRTAHACVASSSARLPVTLLAKYLAGSRMDSPT